jgi:hypothetical protein
MRPARHGRPFEREVRRLTQKWIDRSRGELPRLGQMRLDDLRREFGAVLAESMPTRFTCPLVEPIDPPESYARGVQRLYPGCYLAPGYRVRPAPISPPGAPRLVTDKDLVLCHYERSGIERMPASFARYTRQYIAQIA